MPAHLLSRCMPFFTAVSQRMVMVTVFFLLSGFCSGVGAGVLLSSPFWSSFLLSSFFPPELDGLLAVSSSGVVEGVWSVLLPLLPCGASPEPWA